MRSALSPGNYRIIYLNFKQPRLIIVLHALRFSVILINLIRFFASNQHKGVFIFYPQEHLLEEQKQSIDTKEVLDTLRSMPEACAIVSPMCKKKYIVWMPLAVLKCGGADTGVGDPTCPEKFVNQRETPKPNDLSGSQQAGRNECQKIKICTVLPTCRYKKIETNTRTRTTHRQNRGFARH